MWIRSVLFTTLLFLSVVPWSIAILIARVAGEASAYRLVRSWNAAMVGLCGFLCGLRYTVEGLENLPGEGSVVLMKHSSAYETLVQVLVFPRQCWVLKRELVWAPFFGWALATVRPIAINRSAGRQAVEQVIRQGTSRLAAGIWVMVFPEGTRMAAGETRKYGVAGTLLAQSAGRLIVPVAHNAGDYWPRRGLRKRPGVVTFRIGPPVNPVGREPRQVNAEIQAWIEGQVEELRRQASAA